MAGLGRLALRAFEETLSILKFHYVLIDWGRGSRRVRDDRRSIGDGRIRKPT